VSQCVSVCLSWTAQYCGRPNGLGLTSLWVAGADLELELEATRHRPSDCWAASASAEKRRGELCLARRGSCVCT
jgi:hypothetical protein